MKKLPKSRPIPLIMLLFAILVACSNSASIPVDVENIEVSFDSSSPLRLVNGSVDLPKAAVNAKMSDGTTESVTDAEYTAVRITDSGDVPVDGMSAKEKGKYRIRVTATINAKNYSATYEVTVIGDAAIKFALSESLKDLYLDDTLPDIGVSAISYEDEYGTLKESITSGYTTTIRDPNGGTIEQGAKLTVSGNYTVSVTYNEVTATQTFYVSPGLNPVSFDENAFSIYDKINLDDYAMYPEEYKRITFDANTPFSVVYKDNKSTVIYDYPLFDGNGIKSGITIVIDGQTLSSDNNYTYSFSGKKPGDSVQLEIEATKEALGILEIKGEDKALIGYKGPDSAETITLNKEITFCETQRINNIAIVSKEKGESSLDYVAGDTIDLEKSTFSFYDGLGGEDNTLSISNATFTDDNGVAIPADSIKLSEGANTIYIKYEEAEGSSTIEAAKRAVATEITAINTTLKTSYDVSSGDNVNFIIPDSLEMVVKYQDGETGTVTVTDVSKLTLTLNPYNSQTRDPDDMVNPIIIQSGNTTITASQVGFYLLSVSYSDPSDFTKRQIKDVSQEREPDTISIEAEALDTPIEVTIKAQIENLTLTNTSLGSYPYSAYCVGDQVHAEDATFGFINIYNEIVSDRNKSGGRTGVIIQIKANDGDWTDVVDAYELKANTDYTYRVVYDGGDTDSANSATSEEKSLEVQPLAVPNKIEISKIDDINIDSSRLNQNIKIASILATLTYPDGILKTDVPVTDSSGTVQNGFAIMIDDTPYQNYVYSEGEKRITVSISDLSVFAMRPGSAAGNTTETVSTTGSFSIILNTSAT